MEIRFLGNRNGLNRRSQDIDMSIGLSLYDALKPVMCEGKNEFIPLQPVIQIRSFWASWSKVESPSI